MDLIDRQAAIERIDEALSRVIKGPCGEKILARVPSAQPEIVRCKDCKHRYVEDMIWHCPFGLMGGENFFCGYGSLGTVERRRDG